MRSLLTALPIAGVALLAALARAAEPSGEPDFPVAPELFIDEFRASEGITFNAQGQLFIGANSAVWRVEPDGDRVELTDVHFHLGQAGYGERDILAADFGPTTRLREGTTDDGIIWRITPEGDKSVFARGIGDPNVILVLEDRSLLVSDDFTHHIYHVDPQGRVSIWTDQIPYPNGISLSLDGSILYAAQIFTGLDPVGFSDRLWAIPVRDGKAAGEATVVAETGGSGLDGTVVDEQGRVYIADNGAGKVWRFDPESRELTLIAEGMPHVASLVFGEGDFDHHSLYATSTFKGGGKIWKIPVGVRGAPLHR